MDLSENDSDNQNESNVLFEVSAFRPSFNRLARQIVKEEGNNKLINHLHSIVFDSQFVQGLPISTL